ncbi:hypothetical protein [Nisaea denitrificans]|uniref:hypothetical protein n=1 Tax=Nisaea denitrificans TaxID=390877 RepID=UPI000569E811|nr:hypothetical protein [Nisaea denitrificans]
MFKKSPRTVRILALALALVAPAFLLHSPASAGGGASICAPSPTVAVNSCRIASADIVLATYVPKAAHGFAKHNFLPVSTKEYCYFHHNCRADGTYPKGKDPELYTKRQCKNGGGKSWGTGPRDCQNVNK